MFNFGGMPGGMGGGSPKNVDTSKFYKELGVEKSATPTEIKRAYRQMAKIHHPDKNNGDDTKFKEITKAYEVLVDADKRQKYDKYGEDFERGGGGDDVFSQFFNGGQGRGNGRRRKTKDVVQPIKVTLEQMYNGVTKKMAITRQIIDTKKGVQTCTHCDGKGMKIQRIQMGNMIQQMQSQCGPCGGEGKSFSTKQDREVLEVHVQKGAVDGHKITFGEKADEHPDADAGDVVFILKQQEHQTFKRKGADLFVERTISLVDALCGFSLEITHLDGRKLLIKTSPGDIIKPMARGFDPLADESSAKSEWEVLEGYDCSLPNVAQGQTTDPEVLKQACETQLKRKGIDVGAFVILKGSANFKQCTRAEALEAKKPKKGATMYVLSDPDASKSLRIMKAVKEEGMPTLRDPYHHGNLFVILNIEFPDALTDSDQAAVRKVLPKSKLETTLKEEDPGVEVCVLEDMDPVQSLESNKANMKLGGEHDDDEEDGGGGGGGGVQCAQQ